MIVGRRLTITGHVQGVGFRPFAVATLADHAVAGVVRNLGGALEIDMEGVEAVVDTAVAAVVVGPPAALVEHWRVEPMTPRGLTGTRIDESRRAGGFAAPSIDLAPCADCRRELFDVADRRVGHPFISCVSCGPRYSIQVDRPFDRARTSMAAMTVCSVCDAEYRSVGQRRSHAQTIACPGCGPRVSFGDSSDADALDAAVASVCAGGVIVVHGVGGFHFLADATCDDAVRHIRSIKRRPDRPFAILVPDLDAADRLVDFSASGRALLSGPEAPIVVAPRHADSPLSAAVAPGLGTIGVMLPPSPLHLLLATAADRPLVCTSANRSGEPVAISLDGLPDSGAAVLGHDRRIDGRCDDSVVFDRRQRSPMVVRRSRGLAPVVIADVGADAVDTIAVGADLKNAPAVVAGGRIVAGPHVGDLGSPVTEAAALAQVERLVSLTGAEPGRVACDAHLDFRSTALAHLLADRFGIAVHPVQHHRAHAYSLLVDASHAGPVVIAAFDGHGFGDDGTAWGGELFVGDGTGFERTGQLRPAPLFGGDLAAREPWRMAAAWCCVAAVEPSDPLPQPPPGAGTTSSVGRLLDAAAHLVAGIDRSTYEGQAAIELEALAAASPSIASRGLISWDGTSWDPSELIRWLVSSDGSPAQRARQVHEEVAAATAIALVDVCRRRRIATAGLTGGVFQNQLLSDGIRRHVLEAGLTLLEHRDVPPGDGGIAIGQAAHVSRWRRP